MCHCKYEFLFICCSTIRSFTAEAPLLSTPTDRKRALCREPAPGPTTYVCREQKLLSAKSFENELKRQIHSAGPPADRRVALRRRHNARRSGGRWDNFPHRAATTTRPPHATTRPPPPPGRHCHRHLWEVIGRRERWVRETEREPRSNGEGVTTTNRVNPCSLSTSLRGRRLRSRWEGSSRSHRGGARGYRPQIRSRPTSGLPSFSLMFLPRRWIWGRRRLDEGVKGAVAERGREVRWGLEGGSLYIGTVWSVSGPADLLGHRALPWAQV
jgi:hypothetical protein